MRMLKLFRPPVTYFSTFELQNNWTTIIAVHAKMKAWVCTKLGLSPQFLNDLTLIKGLDNLTIKTNLPIPEPKEGEVVIQTFASSINPVDYKILEWETVSFPKISGLDTCGVIHKVGPNVKDFQTGDIAVVHGSMEKDGTLAEYSCHKADVVVNLTKLFPTATKEQLLAKTREFAAIPCVGGTAYYILIHKLKIHLNKELKNIVITAGSGGVGGACIQLVKIIRPDMQIITTCSSQNFEYVKKLGANICID